MPILRLRLTSLAVAAALCLVLGSFIVTPAAHAQERLEGKFRCTQVETGGQIARCQSPPLVLNRDGSYQIWGERGTYEVVQGRWLVLSHSKRRGLGHFINQREIVFEYHEGKRTCRVTFRQIMDPPAGLRSS
jgi:hypothetical protein